MELPVSQLYVVLAIDSVGKKFAVALQLYIYACLIVGGLICCTH